VNPFLVVNRHQLNARRPRFDSATRRHAYGICRANARLAAAFRATIAGGTRPFRWQPMLRGDRAALKADPIGDSVRPARKTPALGRRGVSFENDLVKQ